MYLKISADNFILEADTEYEKKRIKYVSNGEDVTDEPSFNEIQQGLFFFDFPYVCIENNKFKYLALPGNYKGNIFYYHNDEFIIISDDFWRMCSDIKNVTFCYEYEPRFIKIQSLPLGTTWIKEITTLATHRIYYIEESELVSRSIKIGQLSKQSDKELYNTFKEMLNRTVREYGSVGGKKNSLLLSGGGLIPDY